MYEIYYKCRALIWINDAFNLLGKEWISIKSIEDILNKLTSHNINFYEELINNDKYKA